MNWQDLNTPKKCFNARQSTAGALQDLLAEEKQIIERSTDARLERNRSRQRVLAQDIHEVSRAENSLVQTAAEPARVAEIADLIKKNMHEERGLISEIVTVSTGELGGVTSTGTRVLPSKFIRHDATQHFFAEVEAAEDREKEILAKHRKSTIRPAGRVAEEMFDCQAKHREWQKTKALCLVGEKVAKLRADRQSLSEERDQLQKQRRRHALAV